MSLDAYRERYLPLLEAELRDALDGPPALATHYGMMQYHMGWVDADLRPVRASQGKALRPMLCLMACEACGGRIEHAMPAAAAIELMHNFSLIHDDIEDGSATRRHRSTVWKLWGLAHGVNCGDGMLSAAFLKLSQLQERGVPLQRALSALRVCSETCLTLTEGQHMDMAFEVQVEVSLDDYLSMIRKKTAALIACSVHLGALLGGAEPEVMSAYARFGESLGLAFQVVDDLLGIWGEEAETGKSTSTDILSRKKTLPIVYALHDPDLRAVYSQETVTQQDVDQVLAILDRCGARSFTEQMANECSAEAIRNLDRAGVNTPASRALRDYALTLLNRAS